MLRIRIAKAAAVATFGLAAAFAGHSFTAPAAAPAATPAPASAPAATTTAVPAVTTGTATVTPADYIWG
ncbi:hypothetical protein N4G70_02685 [Streptomyces sp. ASQP_92]|uniref:hypothetical protein n=1 Tax=Streptomyces sp. ASQP_92 TaxID=2979116 RepID=UPI0021BE708E|nr:hypothetical protein [Streptomyces sp. ASQP_92]MCT9087766.1 hypothetical protein [Streptomyces sp. ASQP_92]